MNYLNDIQIVNDSPSEPLSLTEAKSWLKLTFSTDDALVSSLITSARVWIEQYTGRTLVSKKYDAYITVNDYTHDFELPFGPVNSIDTVYDKAAESTVTTANYELYGGKLRIQYNGEFKVTYTAGYGSCPDPLVQDIKRIVAWGYQNRGINFAGDQNPTVVSFPEFYTLNANGYKTVVI
jgi:uncharacterized phiE125 gp8 family phage protein